MCLSLAVSYSVIATYAISVNLQNMLIYTI